MLSLLCLPFHVLPLPRFVTGLTLFFCETLAQLIFSVPLFNSLFFSLSKKSLQMSGLEPSLSWGFDNSASFDGSGFFAAMVEADCVLVDEASVGDWVHITMGSAGRSLRGKKNGVHFYSEWQQKRRRRMAGVVFL